MQVKLGNSSAKEAYRDTPDGEILYRPITGDQITTVDLPDDYSLVEAFMCVTTPDGVWANHSIFDADGNPINPTWVTSDMAGLADLISSNYGGIPTVQPEEVPA